MRKPNPLQDANFCSRLFFCWLNPLFKIGYKRRLEEDDMYSVLPEDRSQHLGEELQGYWDQEVLRAEKDAREPSLMKAILKCHWKSYLVLGIFILLEEGTRVVQPIFLGKMINYVENSNRTDSAALHEAYGYAAGLSTSVRVWAILHHLYFYRIQRVGMRLRVAVCHMIYRKESETPTLQGLSFTVRPGELLAVVGPVGAGKSSLLRALLGELPPSQGQVNVHGRIVYVSQQPWVFSGTVRSNILFGKKYEEERYEKDLQLLKENDITEIGDWGTPLSEGQKAQVSLARAVYQDSDVYLLDDPLSAVDAGVSRHLFEQCIRQALKEKITILVTHQLQYLKDASQILIMKDVAYFLQDWWLAYWANGQSTLYVLVSGNGRMNEIPDPDWYLTLTQVQLKEAIRDLPGKMDTELAEYGSNFSVGQQQLVCLTRAILRTDELIKKEIREKFAQCTVLTIAHRLSTIIDSEWIMPTQLKKGNNKSESQELTPSTQVLDSGRMKEYGRPYDLLQNTNSLFYKMVQQLGEAEAAALTERAEQIHFKKQKIARYHSDLVVMNASSG